eukprot:84821_1
MRLNLGLLRRSLWHSTFVQYCSRDLCRVGTRNLRKWSSSAESLSYTMSGTLERFLSIGVDQKNAKTLVKNEKVATKLVSIIDEAGVGEGCDKAIGNLLCNVATNMVDSTLSESHRPTLCRYIGERKISSVPQLEAALKYFAEKSKFEAAEFESSCGVGVVVTEEEMRSASQKLLESHKSKLVAGGWPVYLTMQGNILSALRDALPWADGRVRMRVFTECLEALIGARPKKMKKLKGKAEKGGKRGAEKKAKEAAPAEEETVTIDKFLQGRSLADAMNSAGEYAEHLKRTGGKFTTRFPPEPNGFLHIGHAKAMNFNFGLAKAKNGDCILRFDDTNPLAEEVRYINSIQENVSWLGHQPSKVTFSSDYFQKLYELAVKMIRNGDAYVCHQTKAEIKAARDHRRKHHEAIPSPFRNRSVDENLELFERMRSGKYGEGEATLRMKGDLDHPNPNMWDPVAYRVLHAAHPHVGARWCIYPSYDFTHCIVDSLEDIDASCCTLEFEIRRESYFWLLKVLDLFRPVVWEYSRLNIEYNVLSKRRLNKLVTGGYVSGWDDPRLLTVDGLRRKGVPASAINSFCEKVGVTRSHNLISPLLLDQCTREALDKTSTRGMAVLDPIKVVLKNFPADRVDEIECANIPQCPEAGTHLEKFTRIVYIDRQDFRMKDAAKYYGLAPGKEVRLKYAYNITCEEVKTDANGRPVELVCSVDFEEKRTIKHGHLHWVSQPAPGQDPPRAELRVYARLFSTKCPGKSDADAKPEEEAVGEEETEDAGKDKWINDLNPDSLNVVSAFVSPSVASRACAWSGKAWNCAFQFERVGYFCVDIESKSDALVFNRTLPLRMSKNKRTV